MRLRRFRLTCALFFTLAAFTVSAVSAQSGKQVYAFYFPWWTEGSWGDGRLIDHPAELYESRDTGAQGRQMGQAQSAGIDGFIVDWYGKDDMLTNTVFNQMLDGANNMGFRIAAAVDLNDGSANTTPDQVMASLNFLIADRVNAPAYLRYDGKPVLYFWNQTRFTVADWQAIRAQVDPNRSTIWVMEGTSTAYLSVFDSLYLFNVAWSGNPASTARQWYGTALRGGANYYTPTVMPGWDESRIAGRTNPARTIDRTGGAYLTKSWNGAVASGTSTILITSWNEYFENSYIEPSQVYGTQALDTLRPLIAAWKTS